MEIDEIIEKITCNLTKNGFPQNKVSFSAASIENFVKKNDYDLEDVLGSLEDKSIFSKKEGEKIIFSSNDFNQNKSFPDIDWSALEKMDPEFLKQQADDLMKKMSPEQINDIKKKFDNLSSSEKEKIMKMASKIKV